MSNFCFSLVMLALFLIARFRAPMAAQLYTPWFFASWIPGELPWAAAILQLAITLLYLIFGSKFGGLDYLGLLISGATVWQWYGLHQKTFHAGHALKTALRQALGENYDEELRADLCIKAPSVIENRDWTKPFAFRRNGVRHVSDIAYGPHPRQRLDIYRPSQSPNDELRPVLLNVHGGAWVLGQKNQQGQPMMQYLTQNGWICVDINYRLSPKHRFPDNLVDVKTAIAWLKTNIKSYGGDPQFIAIAGESAGGHLAALSALTANHAQFQPGFEQSDTRVQAAVLIYGAYNFTPTPREYASKELQNLLEKYVMPVAYENDKALWQKASPLWQVREDAPPVFAVHGTNDCITIIEDARDFVDALRARSQAPVVYAELDGAQHGFEIFHAVRTEFTIEAIGQFLLHCYGKALEQREI